MDKKADREWLYGKMKSQGYDTGTYDDFVNSLNTKEDADWYYDKSIKMGLDVGTREEFDDLFADDTNEEPKSEYQDDVTLNNIVNPNKNQYADVSTLAWNQDNAPDKDGLMSPRTLVNRLKNTNLGTLPYLEEEKKIVFTPKKEKTIQDVYDNIHGRFSMTNQGLRLQKELASISDKVNNKYINEFKNSDEYKDYVNKKYTSQEELDAATDAINRLYETKYGKLIQDELAPYYEAYNDVAFSRYYVEAQQGAKKVAKSDAKKDVVELNATIDNMLQVAEDDDLSMLKSAKKLSDEAQNIIDEASITDGTFFGGLTRGFWDNLRAGNFTFGIADAIDTKNLLSALQKSEKGEELTDAEEKLLEASSLNMITQAYYSDDLGRGYKAGRVTAESLPFMLEFVANPIAGTGNAIAKGLLKFALKRGGKWATSKAAKATGRLIGDAVAAAGMTATTGLGGVIADTNRRLAGNYKYGLDENGNMKVVKKGDLTTSQAAAKATTSRFLENQSEMVFKAFKGWKPFMAAADNELPNGINEFMSRVKKSNVGKLYTELKNSPTLKEVAQRSQWHGLPEEYLEETYNNIANVAIGDMSAEDALSLDNNIDTFLGLAPTSVMFGAIGLGGMAKDRYTNRKRMENVYAAATEDQKAKIDELRKISNEEGKVGVSNYIKRVLRDGNLTAKDRAALLEAAYAEEVKRAIDEVQEAETSERINKESEEIRNASNPNTKTYTECSRIIYNEEGEQEEVEGYIYTYIGDTPLWFAKGQEPTKENLVPLKKGDYVEESVMSMPTDEVIAENEALIREEEAEKAEKESKMSDAIINKKLQNGEQLNRGNDVYTIASITPDGVIYTVNDSAAMNQASIEEWKQWLQDELDIKEKEARIAKNMPRKKMADGRVIVPTSVHGTSVAYNITDEQGNVLESGEMKEDDYAKYEDVGLTEVEQNTENANNVSAEEVQNEPIPTEQIEQNVTKPIPTDDKGQPMYYSAPIADTVADLTDGSLDDNEIDGFVSNYIKVEKNALAKHRKKEPKIGTNKAQYLEEKRKWQEEAASIEKKIAYWEEVEREIQNRRKPVIEDTIESINFDAPLSGEELAAQMLHNGQLHILRESFEKETGGKNGERKAIGGVGKNSIFRTKENGGLTIEEAGELLMLADLEGGTNFFDQNDANAGRNAIIDVLSSIGSRKELKEYIQNKHNELLSRERLGKEEYYDRMRDEYYAEEAYWEYKSATELTREEQIEYYNTYIEDLGFIEFNNGKETSATNEQAGTSSISERSEGLLHQEQSDNEGGSRSDEVESSKADGGINNSDELAQAGETTAERPVAEEQESAPENESILQAAERIAKGNKSSNKKAKRNIVKRINEWIKRGVKINIIEREEEVDNADAKIAIANGEKVAGWYDVNTNEAYIYLPNIDNELELDKTVIHESISHKGLRGLLGEETYNKLCDKVWESMSEFKRKKYLAYVGNKFKSEVNRQRAAADEYMAFLSEKEKLTPKEQSIWNKIAQFIRDVFGGNKAYAERIVGKESVADKEIAELIRLSYAEYIKNSKQETANEEVNDELEEGTRFSAKKKRALETASVSRGKHQPTVVSSADGAKILNNLDILVKEYKEKSSQSKNFLGDVAKAIDARKQGSGSQYSTFETVNGNIVTIRLADHNSTVSNFDNHNESEGISIVISAKDNKGITNDGDAHIVEYFYDSIDLRRADGKPLAEIVRSIKQSLYSGEFKDTTGLAERQEVNPSRFRIVKDKNGKKSLVGLHNISESKLKKAIKQGGLANPSMAVIDLDKQAHVDYGDITLIAPESLVDKKSGKNIGTYMADAYTPIYPTVVKKISDKGAKQFSKTLESVDETFRSKVRSYFNSYLDSGTMYDALFYWYLSDTGKNPPILEAALPEGFTKEEIEKVKSINPETDSFYQLSEDEKEKALSLYAEKFFGGIEKYNEHLADYTKRMQDVVQDESKPQFVRKNIQQNLNAIEQYGYEYDRVAGYYNRAVFLASRQSKPSEIETFRSAYNEVVKNGLEEDFGNWLMNKEAELGVEEKLFAGYDNQGRAKYLPNTLENASKLMRKEGRAGATGLGGFNYFVAILAPVAKNTKQLNSKKQNLSTQEEYDVFAEKWKDYYHDLALQLQPGADKWSDYGYHRLHEIAPMKNPKEYVKKEYGIDLSDKFIKDLNDVKNAIKNDFPARYFETKFERPVYLNEFAAAVVPQGTSKDVVDALTEAGLPVEEYESGNNEARMAAVDKVSSEAEGVRFRIANKNQEIFVSNAQKAVEGIKQEKATPQQWLAMIEKNGGLKVGEDKWLGLSDWLKGQDVKSLTKQEVLDYINANKIQIEEVHYGGGEWEAKLDAFNEEFRELIDEGEEATGSIYTSDWVDYAYEAMVDRYGDDFRDAFEVAGQGTAASLEATYDWNDNLSGAAQYYLGVENPINSTREDYTTEGLENKQEIALVVPTIEPWNESDEIHFGDAGEGRAIAWVRFGETNDEQGDKVLVIDEIQSKRHQEGREKGYIDTNAVKKEIKRLEAERDILDDENRALRKSLNEKYDYNWTKLEEWVENGMQHQRLIADKDILTDEEYEKVMSIHVRMKELDNQLAEAKRMYDGFNKVPSAPFEKNWHELAMKRMLRYAAENGFDKVAWTTGGQQAERYNLGSVIDSISISKSRKEEDKYRITSFDKDTYPISIASGNKSSEELRELFGKTIADELIHGVESLEEGRDTFILEGADLQVGGEGMKGFYDKMLPSFVQKYTKKWGAKVGMVELPEVDKTMHAVDVTDAMKESVMEGQTMFRKSFGGNSGYVGYSMSKRAAEAREEGRFPKTDFKKEYGLTEKAFDALVEAGIIDDSEWHHTSKFGNRTTFYSWEEKEYADYYAEHKSDIDKKAREGQIDSIKKDFSAFDDVIEELREEEEKKRKEKREMETRLLNEYKEYRKDNAPTIPEEYVASNGVRVVTNGQENSNSWEFYWGDNPAFKKYANEARQELSDNIKKSDNRLPYDEWVNEKSETRFRFMPSEHESLLESARKIYEQYKADTEKSNEIKAVINKMSAIIPRSSNARVVTHLTDAYKLLFRLENPLEAVVTAISLGTKGTLATHLNSGVINIFSKKMPLRMVEEGIVHECTHDVVDYLVDNGTISIDDLKLLLEKSKTTHPNAYKKATNAHYSEEKQPYEIPAFIMQELWREMGADCLKESNFADTRLGNIFKNIVKELKNEKPPRKISRTKRSVESERSDLYEGRDNVPYKGSSQYEGAHGSNKDLEDGEAVQGENASDSRLYGRGEGTTEQGDRRGSEIEGGETRFKVFKKNVKTDLSDSRSPLIRKVDDMLHTKMFNFIEAFQDRMYSLKVFMDEVVKATGIPLRSFEDAYKGENSLSSKIKIAQEHFLNDFFKPLVESINDIKKKYDISQEEIETYIYCKSGLERNEVLRQRDADNAYNSAKEELDKKLADKTITATEYATLLNEAENERKKTLSEDKDYSGIRGLYYNLRASEIDKQYNEGKIDKEEHEKQIADLRKQMEKEKENSRSKTRVDWKTFAEKVVADFEQKVGIGEVNNLWSKINNATKETLRIDYECGMIDKETYNNLQGMMKYYVPLRDWENNTADDLYSYHHKTSPITSNQKSAKGRFSQAYNPIVTIASMAQNAIVRGYRNKMKLQFYSFVANRPTDLATVRDVWYVKNGKDWEAVHPDLSNANSLDEVKDALDKHDADMQILEAQGLAFRGKLPFGMKLNASKQQKEEHIVYVKINGKEKAVYVNGAPRVAQAINGMTNSESAKDFLSFISKANRAYGARLTSWNPDFIIPNLVRDTIQASTITYLNKGLTESLKYLSNVPSMLYYVTSELTGNDTKYHKYFEEFIENGGETGYTAVNSLDELKKEYNKALEDVKGLKKIMKLPKNSLSAIASWMESVNRIAEDVNRFNAYISSRQSGNDIANSIDAAKNISVNFNRKGAYMANDSVFGKVAYLMSKWVLFFNPSVQGLAQIITGAKMNKKRSIALISTIMASGFFMPMLNDILVKAFGGDDEDDYMYQNSYNRRTNWMLFVGDGYVKIPLPPVFREIYGMGDVFYGLVTGRLRPAQAVYEIVMLMQNAVGFFKLLPEVTNEPNAIAWAKSFSPDILMPVADVMTNTNFTGAPIAKWTDYNETEPEYKRVYRGTSQQWIALSKFINDLGANDERRNAFFGNFFNPASMEHLVTSYTGGIGTTFNNVVGLIIDNSMKDVEFNDMIRKAPIVKRFYTPVDERTIYPSIRKEYNNFSYRYDIASKALKNYQTQIKNGNTEFQKYIDEMKENGEYDFIKYFKKENKVLNRLNKQLKENPNDKEIEKKYYEKMAEISVGSLERM